MNRTALRLAREVADKTGTLVAGDLCNTNAFDPKDPKRKEKVKEMFKVNGCESKHITLKLCQNHACTMQTLTVMEILLEKNFSFLVKLPVVTPEFQKWGRGASRRQSNV